MGRLNSGERAARVVATADEVNAVEGPSGSVGGEVVARGYRAADVRLHLGVGRARRDAVEPEVVDGRHGSLFANADSCVEAAADEIVCEAGERTAVAGHVHAERRVAVGAAAVDSDRVRFAADGVPTLLFWIFRFSRP